LLAWFVFQKYVLFALSIQQSTALNSQCK